MKTIEDWVDDLDDILALEGECEHHTEADEHGTRVSTSHSISDNGRLRWMELLCEFQRELLKTIDEHYHTMWKWLYEGDWGAMEE